MARDVPAGRAFIELFLDDDKFRQQMRGMRRRLQGVTRVVAGIGAAFTAVGAAAGGVAVAGIIKATNAAGDFAETVSKFETVFGDRAEFVREWAEDTAEALGITRRAALDTLSGFQDLFVPLGLGAEEAEEMSKQLTALSVDLASFNNMDTATVVRDLQAAMTGSSETMKKYGSIVNAAAVETEILATRAITGATGAFTEMEKAQARLSIIMRTTTAAQGDAERTADSYNNSLKRLKTQFDETLTDVGQRFRPAMQQLAQIALEGMKQVRDAIATQLPEIGQLDEVVLDLARSGAWQEAGNIIGLQIKLGLRQAIGPEFFDVLEAWTKRGGFGMMGGLFFQESRQQMGRAGGRLGGLISGAAGMVGFGGEATDTRTEELRDQLELLLAEARKQTQEQRQTREAIENEEGLRLQ